MDPLSLPEARAIDAFGSAGVQLRRLARAEGAAVVTLAELAPGGTIGRHPAASAQLLVVLSGDAVVAGGDGVEHRLGPGEGVRFAPGEEHETRTGDGLVALIVEAASFRDDRPTG